MKPIYKKYFKTIALIWTGCLVLFFIANVLLLAPQRNNKKQLGKDLAEKKQMYASVLELTDEKARARINSQIEQLRQSIRGFVIDSEDLANLTLDISKIANEKKLASFSVRTRDERTGSTIPNCSYITESHMDISFTSSFNQFAAFLNALERHQPIVFINKFTITRSQQNDSSNQVNMDIAVLTRKSQNSQSG